MSLSSLQIEEYSDKCLVIRPPEGEDPNKYKDVVRKVGGRWNTKLNGGPGWIVLKSKYEQNYPGQLDSSSDRSTVKTERSQGANRHDNNSNTRQAGKQPVPVRRSMIAEDRATSASSVASTTTSKSIPRVTPSIASSSSSRKMVSDNVLTQYSRQPRYYNNYHSTNPYMERFRRDPYNDNDMNILLRKVSRLESRLEDIESSYYTYASKHKARQRVSDRSSDPSSRSESEESESDDDE